MTPSPKSPTASPKRDRGFTPQSINELFLRADTLIEGIGKNPEIRSALKTDLKPLTALLAKTRTLFIDIASDTAPQEPTLAQRDALGDLGREVGKLRKHVRRALSEHPELLERLGI